MYIMSVIDLIKYSVCEIECLVFLTITFFVYVKHWQYDSTEYCI